MRSWKRREINSELFTISIFIQYPNTQNRIICCRINSLKQQMIKFYWHEECISLNRCKRNKIFISRLKTTLGEWFHMFISFFLSPVFCIWVSNSLLFLSRSITHCLHWEWFWARKWRRPKQVYISLYPWCWQGRVDRENITHLSKHDFIHCNCL